MTISEIREEMNMTQREFAELIGVTQTAVYKWEKSDVKFKAKEREKVIQGLNLKNVDYNLTSYNIKY